MALNGPHGKSESHWLDVPVMSALWADKGIVTTRVESVDSTICDGDCDTANCIVCHEGSELIW